MTLEDLKRKKNYEMEVQEIVDYVAALNIKDVGYRNALIEIIKGELARPMFEDGTYPEMDRDYGNAIKAFAAFVIDTEITGTITEQLKQLYNIVLREYNAFKDVFARYKEGIATGAEIHLQEARFYVTECEFEDVLNQNAIETENRYPELESFTGDNLAQYKDDTKQECIETIEYLITCFDILYPFAAKAIETDDKERYYYASLFLGIFMLRLGYPMRNIRKYYQQSALNA